MWVLGGGQVYAAGSQDTDTNEELEAGAEGSAPFWWCDFGEVDGSSLYIVALVVIKWRKQLLFGHVLSIQHVKFLHLIVN